MFAQQKKGLLTALIVFWVVVATSNLYAGGYEFGGLGSRAVSMGGAFIGLSDDWTAIYWNPAGLTWIKGKKVGISGGYPVITLRDENSVSNVVGGPLIFAYPTEPSKFNQNTVDEKSYLFALGGYQEKEEVTLGFGFYIPDAYSSNWEDRIKDPITSANIYGKYLTELFIAVSNFSLAKKLMPELSIGTGLNLVYGRLEVKADKEYRHPTLPALFDYDFDYRMAGNGFGIEGMIGFLMKPLSNLKVGGVLRSGSTLKLEGSAETKFPVPVGTTSLISGTEKSDYIQKFAYPSTLGLGLAYRLNPKLVITTDWVRTYWNAMEEDIDFDLDTGTGSLLLKDVEPKSSDWDNTDRLRVGIEFKPDQKWSLRAGFFTDPSPVPAKGVDFTKIIDVDRNFITLGIGYELKTGQIEAGYIHASGDERLNGVKYGWEGDSYAIDCLYKF